MESHADADSPEPTPRAVAAVASPLCRVVLAVFLLAGCTVPTTRIGESPTAPGMPPYSAYLDRQVERPMAWLPLEGEAQFSIDELSESQRAWHARLWTAIEASRSRMLRLATADDLYEVGRWLFQYDAALLLGLRTTGDLRFLDEVDVIAEALRRALRDGWCGGVASRLTVNVRYGDVSEPDGFRNLRYRAEPGRDYCRDTGDLDETLTHGHLAMLMYAYHANRELPSPSGIDYGERADFWLDYLLNDFEAKWRSRSGTAFPDMDFIDLKFCHTYSQMLLYYHFIGMRLADDGSERAVAYQRQVARLTDAMQGVAYIPGRRPGGFVDVSTPIGPAVIYSFGAPGVRDRSDVLLEACPVTYARYMLTSALVLRLEGVDGWNDETMRRLATGIAHYVIDTEPLDRREKPFAAGVSGSLPVAGMPPTTYRGRYSVEDAAATPFAALAVWEASGELGRSMAEVYEAVEGDTLRPRRVYIPAGTLLFETIGPRD